MGSRTNFVDLSFVHVPDPCGAVSRARHDQTAVARKVERVDLLLVSLEDRPDPLFRNVPYLHTHTIRDGEPMRIGDAGAKKLEGVRTRICLSSAPVARYRPSGLKHTLRMYKSPVLLVCVSSSTLQ